MSRQTARPGSEYGWRLKFSSSGLGRLVSDGWKEGGSSWASPRSYGLYFFDDCPLESSLMATPPRWWVLLALSNWDALSGKVTHILKTTSCCERRKEVSCEVCLENDIVAWELFDLTVTYCFSREHRKYDDVWEALFEAFEVQVYRRCVIFYITSYSMTVTFFFRSIG